MQIFFTKISITLSLFNHASHFHLRISWSNAWTNVLEIPIQSPERASVFNRYRIEAIYVSNTYLPSAWQTPNFHVLSSSIPIEFAWRPSRIRTYIQTRSRIRVCVLYQLHRPLTSEVARELGREPTTVRRRVSRIFAEKGDTAPLKWLYPIR